MNCSTVAGAPVFSNYYKKRTIAGFKERYLSDAQHISPVMTRPRVPDDKRQRTARACDSCKRRKQKVSLQIISHISFIWPPDTWTLGHLNLSFLFVRSDAHILAYTFTFTFTYTNTNTYTKRSNLYRDYIRAITHHHTSIFDY